MKRIFLCALAISLSVIGSAAAKDDVREVQTKLKDGGFYFGEIDGALSSDLSAAITRYQIRNGLQITGNLNLETSKLLGVKPEVSASPAPVAAGGETWRQLRRTDPKFLEKLNAQRSSPAPVARPAKSASPPEPMERAQPPPAALVPARPEDNSTLVLSRERLRDYIAAFVLAGLDPQVGAEAEFFADRVRYYNDGIVGREKIRGDLQRYDRRWPERRFWLAGEINVETRPGSRLRVTFPLRFELQNGSRHSSGKVLKTLVLEVVGEDLQIVAVDERRA